MRLRLLSLLLLSVCLMGRKASAQSVQVVGDAQIAFDATSTLHNFSGTAAASPFHLQSQNGERWSGAVAVPVGSMNTDNGWRDDAMRDMLHAKRCPLIQARFEDVDPAAVRANRRLPFLLTICDVTRNMEATISGWRQDDQTLSFTASFELSLTSFELKAPRTLFMRVGDTVKLAVDAKLRRK
jgi:hypothetical protein